MTRFSSGGDVWLPALVPVTELGNTISPQAAINTKWWYVYLRYSYTCTCVHSYTSSISPQTAVKTTSWLQALFTLS